MIFDGEPVSIEELSTDDFSVYPNPSDGLFNVISEKQLDQIIVTDMLGREVLSINVTSQQQIQVDLTNAMKGVYMMTLFSEGKSITKKLIIE